MLALMANYTNTFTGRIALAFVIDLLSLYLWSKPITALVLMIFVWLILHEEIYWPHVYFVMGLLLLQGFMIKQPFGFPLVYLIPIASLGRQVRRLMHFSRAYYPLFLCLLLFFEAIGMGQGFAVAGIWSSSTAVRFCANIMLMTVFSLK